MAYGDTNTAAEPVDDDPYAAIREAASRNQVEAARLMQTENFREARILLDKAIVLLQSIPQMYVSWGAPCSCSPCSLSENDCARKRPKQLIL